MFKLLHFTCHWYKYVKAKFLFHAKLKFNIPVTGIDVPSKFLLVRCFYETY
jgi:hypothetical protein